MTTAAPQRIAIVHDWLVSAGGGEQVLAEVLREFPNADLFSSIDKMSAADRDRLGLKAVHTSPLQSLPGIGRYYRSLLPLMPWAMRQLDVSAYAPLPASSSATPGTAGGSGTTSSSGPSATSGAAGAASPASAAAK